MRDNIRQWFVNHPRAMDGAYAFLLASTFAFEAGLMDSAGGNTGP